MEYTALVDHLLIDDDKTSVVTVADLHMVRRHKRRKLVEKEEEVR